MCECIFKWIGLFVLIGIGWSKIEVKIVNYMVKKVKCFLGVCNLVFMDLKYKDYFFSLIDVFEVWGVGW